MQQHQQQQQVTNMAPHTPAAYPAAAAAAAAAQGDWGGSGQVWLKPTSLDQLTALLQRHCGSKLRARLVAGNTGECAGSKDTSLVLPFELWGAQLAAVCVTFTAPAANCARLRLLHLHGPPGCFALHTVCIRVSMVCAWHSSGVS
jgi:hypothetical protein